MVDGRSSPMLTTAGREQLAGEHIVAREIIGSITHLKIQLFLSK
jgi:hypothetical protein